jgi:4-amino-4-deoxy-L-arabinose transferase-like glycosyltransferase
MLQLLKQVTGRKIFYPIVITLIIFFTLMRLIHINADAPQDLTMSAASYTDEGFKTYDARNMVLFGDWKWTPEDEYEGWNIKSPLTVLPHVWVFKHFGVSYASIRILSVLYAAATMALIFIFLARNYDRLTALTGLVLFGINYFAAMFNRLGMYESHLIFYIMVSVLGFSESFRPFRDRHESESDASYATKKALYRAAFFMIGFIGFAGGFFVKRNLLILVPAMAPAVILYICNRYNLSERIMNGALLLFVAIFAVIYIPFAHMDQLKVNLAFLLMSYKIFGQPVSAFLPFTAFDPLQNVLAKGIYMEFIFLHPFTFFISILFSLYAIYRYIFGKRRNTADLFLACWLLFGLLFTTVMYYSPSRYYLLLIIPLVSLASRVIADFGNNDSPEFFTEKKRFPYNLVFSIFILFTLLYTGIVLLVHTIPQSVKNLLVDRFYPAIVKGDFSNLTIIMTAAAVLWLACIITTIVMRKRLINFLKNPKFPAIILSIIMALQLFQYGKWFLFHEHTLYNASKELGRELPPNAILAGSWSAGLVVENKTRAIIIQSLIPYNYKLINKIIYDVDISVNSLQNGRKATGRENGIPLYLAVCRNVIFEKAITQTYQKQLIPENLIKTIQFGYFKVEIYKLVKYHMETKNAVQSLFNRFL